MPPSPPGVTAAAVSARCVASAHSRCLRSPRARSANTAFVTAMNGTPSGTASNGMPRASARRRQRVRRPLMGKFGAQPETDRPHAGVVKLADIRPAAVDGAWQEQPDCQQQLAALQPWSGMSQLGHRCRLDLPFGAAAACHQLEAK